MNRTSRRAILGSAVAAGVTAVTVAPASAKVEPWSFDTFKQYLTSRLGKPLTIGTATREIKGRLDYVGDDFISFAINFSELRRIRIDAIEYAE